MSNQAIKLPAHAPLVVATRGDAVESVHYGSIAVVDAAGQILCGVGDTAFPMYTRSTLKPFQALPFVADGGPARYGFSSQQLALLCASHSGEPRHVAAVADMLARIGCDEAKLQCGCHVPAYYAATGTTPPPDLALSPLQHNCSGKHAGFLGWCRLHGAPLASYLDPAHPLQQAIRNSFASLLGLDDRNMAMGIDGCGAPNYAVPLAALARAYAMLATHDADALAMLYGAMRAHPEMVSGEARDDLLLMQAAPDWIAKGGAEGVQAFGLRDRSLGIAIKIADGNRRALQSAVAAVIAQLDLLPAGSEFLDRWQAGEIRNYAGTLTGRYLSVFELA